MVRKQIYLTPAQNERLRRAAKQQRRSEAELLREAVDLHLMGPEQQPVLDDDALFRLIGAGASEDGESSEHVDDILYGRGGA